MLSIRSDMLDRELFLVARFVREGVTQREILFPELLCR